MRLAEAIGRPEIGQDARFKGLFDRIRNRDEMDSILQDVFSQRTSAEWVEILNATGIAAGPIYKLDQVFADPQVQLAGLIHEVTNAEWGPHKVLQLPVKLSRTPAQVEYGAPMTGEHTRQTLEGLGYSAAAIDTLLADKVIEQSEGGQS